MGTPVIKRYVKQYEDKKKIALKYFQIMSIHTGVKLAKMELELLAYIATKGTISSINSRKEFTELFNTTMSVINNTISKLYKKKFLVKKEGKIRINPSINVDFINNDSFYFVIKCLHKEKE